MRLGKKKPTAKQPPSARRVMRGSDRPNYTSYHAVRRESESASGMRQVLRSTDPDDARRGEAQGIRSKLMKAKQRKKQLVFIAAGLLVLVLIWSVTFVGSSVRIAMPTTGAKSLPLLHTQAEYQAAATKLLNSSTTNHNKLTIDSGGIEQQLKRQYPELKLVAVSLPLFGATPTVTIVPSMPAALLQTVSSGSFVLDSSGFAVADAADIKGVDLPIIADQSGIAVARGNRVLPSSSMDFIDKITRQLAEKQITIESFILPKGSAHEIDVRIVGASYYGKFSSVKPDTYDQQIGDYLALRGYLESKRIMPSEYVDVRLAGRAYFK